MSKKEVSFDYFQLLRKKVENLEAELGVLHKESKECFNEGDTSRPELGLEDQLQKTLRAAKLTVKNCQPIPNPRDNDSVQIGSKVEIYFNGSSRIFRLEGVSNRNDVCSTQSPLGSQIIGAKVGDNFMVGKNQVQIKSIT